MRRSVIVLSSIAGLIVCGRARAVVLESTGDTTANTTAPTGSFSNSGWQYEGNYGGAGSTGGFSATPIGPHTFISASHITPGVGLSFFFNGTAYTVTGTSTGTMATGAGVVNSALANRDIVVVTVSQTFPYWAPVYSEATDGSLVGKTAMDIGRGTQRGTAINVSTSRGAEGTLRGWNWGAADGVQRWGTNVITGFLNDSGVTNNYLTYNFDFSGQPNESTVSQDDSGGGLFVQGANGVWKLAGINSQVDAAYSIDGINQAGNGSIFDFHDLYFMNSNNQWQLATTTMPQEDFQANLSDLSASALAAYMPIAGDVNADGKVNASDFAVLAAHYGMSNEHWLEGDLNFDGVVNAADFNILASKFNTSSSAAALAEMGVLVPEPGSAALVLVTALSIASSRRRRPAAR